MRIGLIPLDERPVNTRYPQMIAAIAGAEVVEPPLEMLSAMRTPADPAQLADWLRTTAPDLDMLIVSLEMLGHGGLLASRITHTTTPAIAATLDVLRQIRQAYPALVIYGFNVITRIAFSDDSFEEPRYWSDYGSRIYTYSQLFDQQQQGQDTAAALADLGQQIPPEHLQDFMQRRLRNHIINLLALQMAAEKVFDLLVISSDDTSEYGLGTREKHWLTEWAERLALDNLLLYPGADEVGAALLARALNQHHGHTPAFALRYAIPGDEEITAPFEDGPVRLTLERQVRAVGGRITEDAGSADFIVAVNTPSRRFTARQTPYGADAEAERAHRTPLLLPFVQQIQAWIEAGRRVIVTDVAYPNGADPALVDLLREHADITRLAAYGAWNTAGNTIGVALAHGIAAALAAEPPQHEAQARFLLHRFIEDWAYQYHVRRAHVPDYSGRDLSPELAASIEQGLQAHLALLPGFAATWRIQPGSVRFPWRRLFEVDFDLAHAQDSVTIVSFDAG